MSDPSRTRQWRNNVHVIRKMFLLPPSPLPVSEPNSFQLRMRIPHCHWMECCNSFQIQMQSSSTPGTQLLNIYPPFLLLLLLLLLALSLVLCRIYSTWPRPFSRHICMQPCLPL